MKRRKLSSYRVFRLGGRPVFRLGGGPFARVARRVGRFLVKSQILTVFFGLCLLGFIVGMQTRPAPGTFPHAEVFDQMSVVSYRESPSDSTSRFVVQLAAGGDEFSQYDIEARAFLPPSRGRPYGRTITGTHYGPLRVRGHVGYGFWLDVPDSRRVLLPEQFDELYRTTLNFVKPVSRITGVLGILSGYSVGYRLGAWNSSLSSRAVQERVLATPDLGRTIAREAWRRVLLEPVVMTGENDATRLAAVTGTHRLYANFFRLALDDSNGFIPREAARLEQLGKAREASAMLAFAEAVRRVARDTVHLANQDFAAIERWATLLDRRGHWAHGAIPPPGEERIKLLGTLAWYGLAPPGQNVDRVWVGPRMLVRVGESDAFVADEIPRTGTGCPISWHERLGENHGKVSAIANAWLADRPEFAALATLGQRTVGGLAEVSRAIASWHEENRSEAPVARPATRTDAVAFANRAPAIAIEVVEPDPRAHAYPFRMPGGDARILVVAADSAEAARAARAAQTVAAQLDSLTETGHAADAMADALRSHGTRDALIEVGGATAGLGTSAGGDPWSVVVHDPRGRVPAIARLRLAPGQAIATSSRLDSAADVSAGLIGIAVLAPDATAATALTAALSAVDREEAMARARLRTDVGLVLIEAGDQGLDVIRVEAELKDRFILDSRAADLFRVEYF